MQNRIYSEQQYEKSDSQKQPKTHKLALLVVRAKRYQVKSYDLHGFDRCYPCPDRVCIYLHVLRKAYQSQTRLYSLTYSKFFFSASVPAPHVTSPPSLEDAVVLPEHCTTVFVNTILETTWEVSQQWCYTHTLPAGEWLSALSLPD